MKKIIDPITGEDVRTETKPKIMMPVEPANMFKRVQPIDKMSKRYISLDYRDKFTDKENEVLIRLYKYLWLEGKRDKIEEILSSDLPSGDIILASSVLFMPNFLDEYFATHSESKEEREVDEKHVRVLKEYFELEE